MALPDYLGDLYETSAHSAMKLLTAEFAENPAGFGCPFKNLQKIFPNPCELVIL